MSQGSQPGRILLVDDDPYVRRGYGRMLRARGWIVDDALDGREAVTRLGTVFFDAIVSDIDMPHMGGLALVRAVHERDPDVPVVLITGAPSLKTAIQAVEQGAFRYLIKPVDMTALDEVMRLAARFHRAAKSKLKVAEREAVLSRRTELLRGVRGAFGSGGEIGLPELVQLLSSTGKTGILKISGSSVSGEIHFLDGAVVDASCDGRRAEAAFYALVVSGGGAFSFDPTFRPTTRAIERTSEFLLLEAMRRVDEAIL